MGVGNFLWARYPCDTARFGTKTTFASNVPVLAGEGLPGVVELACEERHAFRIRPPECALDSRRSRQCDQLQKTTTPPNRRC
jgi:hypothetical protein